MLLSAVLSAAHVLWRMPASLPRRVLLHQPHLYAISLPRSERASIWFAIRDQRHADKNDPKSSQGSLLFLRWAQINGSAFHELLDLISIKVRCEKAQEFLLSRLASRVATPPFVLVAEQEMPMTGLRLRSSSTSAEAWRTPDSQ